MFLAQRADAFAHKPDSRIASSDFQPHALSGYDSTMADRRILVVDDDKRLRELLPRYLGETGFVVQTAENAEAMDKALARDMFDLIVLDLMLPGEDGLSICRRLRASGPEQAVIMLTAKGGVIVPIVGLVRGAVD